MSIGDYWNVRLFNWKEQAKVVRRFYPDFRFAALDLALGSLYLISNPYRVCRRFFQKRGEFPVHLYGETPLTAWASIAELAELKQDDVFLDLGCGRGRLCFWTHFSIGCSVRGIDGVPSFIKKASFLSRLFRLPKAQFAVCCLKEANLEEATVVYLYTFHPEEDRLDFSRLQKGARVITVSEPLDRQDFFLKTEGRALYPWGESEVYINVKK